MTVLVVEYDPDSGNVVRGRHEADHDYSPATGELIAPDDISKHDLDRYQVQDGSLVEAVTEGDEREREALRELSRVESRIERLLADIQNDHIPDRANNANVDAVLSDLETRRDDLRGRVGQ